MSESAQNIVVLTLADGATAELRRLSAMADRDAARRIYTELRRLSAEIARNHGFGDKPKINIAETTR